MKELNYIRVVLVEPTHPGNIGAAARSMANMGVNKLLLVKPHEFPSPVANARAAGADWILEKAETCESLDQAVAQCGLVLGTTARRRSIDWPSLEPWEAMEKSVSYIPSTEVAIVFGRESKGLTNAELDRCHHLVRIPVQEEFSSLNLASAVTVLLYELRKSLLLSTAPDENNKDSKQNFANAEETRRFYEHMEEVLQLTEFIDQRSSKLMRKLIRIYNRANLSREEVNILRGILSSVEYKINSIKRDS